jgi:hypothetical protein
VREPQGIGWRPRRNQSRRCIVSGWCSKGRGALEAMRFWRPVRRWDLEKGHIERRAKRAEPREAPGRWIRPFWNRESGRGKEGKNPATASSGVPAGPRKGPQRNPQGGRAGGP